MARVIYAVVAKEVINTGMVSYMFMIWSQPPDDIFDWSHTYGLLELKEKDHNHVNPFKLARGEPGAVGPDGYLRWNIKIFKSGEGLVLAGGWDEDRGPETNLREVLKDAPDCVLLMDEATFARFEGPCRQVVNELKVYHHPAELATS